MSVELAAHPDILANLRQAVGQENVFDSLDDRRFYSSDLYSEGEICTAAVRPADKSSLARAVRVATSAGYAVVPRGGGLTYVGGYTPTRRETITIDVSGLNRI